MVLTYFSIAKRLFLKQLSLLMLLCSVLFLPVVYAGGGGVDPNQDMRVSLIYDVDKSTMLPYSLIVNRLFPELSALPEHESPVYDYGSFLSELEQIALQANRQVKTGYQWQADNNEKAESFVGAVLALPKIHSFESRYTWGACANRHAAAIDFIRALSRDARISDAEYVRIAKKRVELMANCYSSQTTPPASEGETPYDIYLEGAFYFYTNQFAQAMLRFQRLASADSAWFSNGENWITETAAYLVGRVALLHAQEKWNGYSYWDGTKFVGREELIDAVKLQQSVNLFEQYLQRYPRGRYLKSASGLIRRAQYFQNNITFYQQDLRASIQTAFAAVVKADLSNQTTRFTELKRLIQEYELHGHDASFELLSALVQTLEQEKLEQQKSDQLSDKMLALYQELSQFEVFLAEHQSGDIRLRELSRLQKSPLFELYLSVYVRFWQKQEQHDTLLSAMSEYADAFTYSSDPDLLIAQSLKSSNNLAALFDYPNFKHTFVKHNFMQDSCNIAVSENLVLKQRSRLRQAEDQAYLAQVVVDYYLERGDFTQLKKLYALYSDKDLSHYASIRTAIEMIVNRRNAGKGYMNVGYFMAYRARPYTPRIAGACRRPQNNAYDYFLQAMSELPDGQDQAKTMHFLTLCGRSYKLNCGSRPSLVRKKQWRCNSAIGCEWQVNMSEVNSKYWFQRLHKHYPNSKWADKTPYYYD